MLRVSSLPLLERLIFNIKVFPFSLSYTKDIQRVIFLCSVFTSHTIMADQIGNLIDEKELTPIYVKGNTTSTSSNFFIDSNPKAEGFLIGVGGENTTNYTTISNKIVINPIEGIELKKVISI